MQMKRKETIYRKMLFFLLMCLGISGCSRKPDITVDGFIPGTETQEMYTETEPVTEQLRETETDEMLQVFVCGAVINPGVYRLKKQARIYEAVEAAGGFGTDADRDWLNMAEVVQDGEKIRVYTAEETQKLRASGLEDPGLAASPGMSSEVSGTGEKINLNTATREQLMSLPGIGEAKADAVIAYRKERGRFQNIEEIMNINGIKEAVFFKIKDRITV